MRRKLFTLSIVTLVLSGCAGNPEVTRLVALDLEQLGKLLDTGTQDIEIKWEVDDRGSGPELLTKSVKNPGCRGRFAQQMLEEGCFVAEKNQALEINFRLKKNFGGEKWRFTQLRLCSGKSEDDKASCALSEDQQVDFLVEANGEFARFPADGRVDLSPLSPVLRSFNVRVFNFTEGEYVYELTACKEGSSEPEDCAVSDPGGINKGRSRG